MLHALPAGFGEALEGLLEALGGGDLAVVPEAGLLVARMIERRDDFAAELRILLEHRFDGVGGRVFAARQFVDGRQSCQFVHHEQHVLQGGLVAHGDLLNYENRGQVCHSYTGPAINAVLLLGPCTNGRPDPGFDATT
jgi:hypothetical protein